VLFLVLKIKWFFGFAVLLRDSNFKNVSLKGPSLEGKVDNLRMSGFGTEGVTGEIKLIVLLVILSDFVP